MSKIQNERKSQLLVVILIHLLVVFNMSKIQNERKSQLSIIIDTPCDVVFNMSKIQNETDGGGSRIPTKNYIIIMSKGNHNISLCLVGWNCVVFNMSKIQNERKSQHKLLSKVFESGCVQHVKDTK